MAERSLVTLMAAGLRTKAAVDPTTFGGPLRELSGVGLVREPFAGAWQRNITVEGTGGLLSSPSIYACVTRIAGDISKLGMELLDTGADGIPVLAEKNSPFWRVLRQPNSYQNQNQFFSYWLLCKLLFGNVYALKQRDERGMVSALYLLNPRSVCPLVTPDGGVYYSIGGDQLARAPNGYAAAPASEVIHDRGPTLWHPLVGVPPLYAAALSGTLGLQIQRNSIAFFGNMSRPSGILTAPGTIEDTTADRLKRDWDEKFSGQNVGRLAVLGDGLTYEALTMSAEQSDLAKQAGISAVDAATAFGMPAYKINQGQMPTNNNVQALNQQYYSDCLQVHIESAEACMSQGLELRDGLSVEFNLEGLLRMDSATQMDVLTKGTKGGLIKPNEGRKRLRLPPVNGGDTLYMQQQDYSIEALAKRDAKDDPFGKGETPAPAPAPAPPGDDAAAEEEAKRVAGMVTKQIAESAEQAAAGVEKSTAAAAAQAVEGLTAAAAAAAEQVKVAAAEAEAAATQQRAAAEVERTEAAARAAAAFEQATTSAAQSLADLVARAEAAAAALREAPAVAPAPPPAPEPGDEDAEAFAKHLIEGLEALDAAA